MIVLDQANYSLMQSKYSTDDWRLVPNIKLVGPDNQLLFQINALGLKGSKVGDSSCRHVAVWGDSVTFGIGRGWVELASDSETIFLAGGIEGAPARPILRNALETNKNFEFDLNIFSLGWHSARNPLEIIRVLLGSRQLPNLCLMTMPCSLSKELSRQDLSEYFLDTGDADSHYSFWGSLAYSIRTCRILVNLIDMQNLITRWFAKTNGIPLFDLASAIDPHPGLQSFRGHFFDLGHPRPKSYGLFAGHLGDFAKLHL